MTTIVPFCPYFIPFQQQLVYNNSYFAKVNNPTPKESIKDNLSVSTEISTSEVSEINPNSNYNLKNNIFNLPDKVIKEAFFVPKKLRLKNKKEENAIIKNDCNINKAANENTTVLKIEVKVSKNKVLYLEFGRFDNVYELVNKFCKENDLDCISRFIVISNVLKAFSSIYSIYNLKLKEDEIQFIKELKEEYMQMNPT